MRKQLKRFTESKWFHLLTGVVITLLLLGWIFYRNSANQELSGNTSSPKQKVPAKSKIAYRDPDRYFDMQIPASWQIKTSYGTERHGIGTVRELTTKLEIVNLSSENGIGINILIYENPPSCSLAVRPETTLAGLPASYDQIRKAWTLYTTNATFSINYYYPGAGVFRGYLNRYLTPVPQAQMQSNQKMIDGILSTFQPKNPRPLGC